MNELNFQKYWMKTKNTNTWKHKKCIEWKHGNNSGIIASMRSIKKENKNQIWQLQEKYKFTCSSAQRENAYETICWVCKSLEIIKIIVKNFNESE